MSDEQKSILADAEQWGAQLNDATWAFLGAWDAEVLGPVSAVLFNNLKPLVRVGILKYLEGYSGCESVAPAKDKTSGGIDSPRCNFLTIDFVNNIVTLKIIDDNYRLGAGTYKLVKVED